MEKITKTYEVYNFNELSEEAKDRAISDYRSDAFYFWGDEAIASLHALAEKFNASFKRYQIDWLDGWRNEYQIDVPAYMGDLEEEELREIIDSLGSYDKKTLKGKGDCVLTGVCFDEDAIYGLRKAYFEWERDIKELLQSAFNSWYKACQKDFEYQFSEEGFSEHCEVNNYKFLEDGTLF